MCWYFQWNKLSCPVRVWYSWMGTSSTYMYMYILCTPSEKRQGKDILMHRAVSYFHSNCPGYGVGLIILTHATLHSRQVLYHEGNSAGWLETRYMYVYTRIHSHSKATNLVNLVYTVLSTWTHLQAWSHWVAPHSTPPTGPYNRPGTHSSHRGQSAVCRTTAAPPNAWLLGQATVGLSSLPYCQISARSTWESTITVYMY